MTDIAASPPNCPITGLPAARLIQNIGSRFLQGLWRDSFGVDATGSLADVKRFGLWESPCGLAFFDPMTAGDAGFYHGLYGRLGWHDILGAPGVRRPEFTRGAALVPNGAALLDVGAGEGGFSRFAPGARYVGLEPNAVSTIESIDIRNETIERHAQSNAGAYDVVCAFEVIEHVADPFGFATAMVSCLKPGGRFILGVPNWPSPLTDIPDFAMNAPPHHLTWWTENALRALCDRLGLNVESVQGLPPGSHDTLIYWMARLSPKLTGKRYFRAHKGWYLALAWAWLAGRVADALFTPPEGATPMTLLLSARRPL
jgi:SAM-dependent methyltransferase